ncbi:hypothetical protein LJ707_01945 [Mucilaginibacter sp. UR6-1]|uniref:hypothetical protein n=1 Tax=Mucilaginibacter sp. UR6-1 TaxID=1435643 RepID=UPI001E4ECF9D|nr:hypothetical protein [Mucilaginibacter sp. UR6-1]MCC8407672.1 hypothetical protein [Mucilaginibacter sp. UR6-1]
MSGYTIVDHIQIENHISFIRIDPTDISLTLRNILVSFNDLSWIRQFDDEYQRVSYQVRARKTADHIANFIIKAKADKITSSSAEYVVSELARQTIVEKLNYLDIPLAELFKKNIILNPGFDFYTRNLNEILLFGEAKYVAKQSAFGRSLEQIIRFANQQQDISDLNDIKDFFCKNSMNNCVKGHKGYIAAFSAKATPTDQLIKSIKRNKHFVDASKYKELICVAVNL